MHCILGFPFITKPTKFDQHSTSFTLYLILKMHIYSKHLCFKQIVRYCKIIYLRRGAIFVKYDFFACLWVCYFVDASVFSFGKKDNSF